MKFIPKIIPINIRPMDKHCNSNNDLLLAEKIVIVIYLYKYCTMENCYISLDYSPIHLLETIYEEASCANNYYLSPVNVLRCDASPYLRAELSKIINAPFTCCGFLKTNPLQTYPMHTDAFRIAAINMPLFDETIGFESYVFDDKKLETIKYKRNHFTLLNVTKPHGVSNKNSEHERIILSIGFKNQSYENLIKSLNEGKLINDII